MLYMACPTKKLLLQLAAGYTNNIRYEVGFAVQRLPERQFVRIQHVANCIFWKLLPEISRNVL